MSPENFIAGCERIGLTAELRNTKSPQWHRVFIHQRGGCYAQKCAKNPNNMGLYIGRASFQNGQLSSIKLFCDGSYEASAIRLMISKGVILNHINFYALGQQAYNAAYKEVQPLDKKSIVAFNKLRGRLFAQYFNEHYTR